MRNPLGTLDDMLAALERWRSGASLQAAWYDAIVAVSGHSARVWSPLSSRIADAYGAEVAGQVAERFEAICGEKHERLCTMIATEGLSPKHYETTGLTYALARQYHLRHPAEREAYQAAICDAAISVVHSVGLYEKMVLSGNVAPDAGSVAMKGAMWRAERLIHGMRPPVTKADVTTDGKALPATAAVFVVGRDVVDRITSERDDGGSDEA
jgi:hypothetical protein